MQNNTSLCIFIKFSLSDNALEIIKDFYIKLRENQDPSFPITTRQLESLVRLSQARAKIDLRNEVTEDDAQEVLNLKILKWK